MACITTMNTSNYYYASFGNSDVNSAYTDADVNVYNDADVYTNDYEYTDDDVYNDADVYNIINPYYVSKTNIDSINKQNNIKCDSNENKFSIPPTIYKIRTPAGGIGTTIEAMDKDINKDMDMNNDNDNDSIASSVCSSCYPDSSEEDNIIPLSPNKSLINSQDISRPNSMIGYSSPDDLGTGVSRSVMYEYLIKYFPEFPETNNKQKLVKFLSKQLMCNCTDCGGYDSICECEIESEYEKHFGVIVQQNNL